MKKHTNVQAIDNSKRLLFKGMLLGAGAIAFTQFLPLARAMNAAIVPPVNSLILDEQCSVGGLCDDTNVSTNQFMLRAESR